MDRIIRVLRFDASVFREIAGDTGATTTAWIIVVVSSLLAALGKLINFDASGNMSFNFLGVILGFVFAIIGFAIICAAIAEVCNRFLGGKCTTTSMIRTLGYTNIWQVVGVFGLIPCLGALISFILLIVSIIANVLAVRETAGITTGKAIVGAVLGGILGFVIIACSGTVLGLIGGGAAAALGG